MPAQLSSTAQDMARHKSSEIDHLNGYIARRGAELGVPTPVNRALHALVKLVESGSRPAGDRDAARARAPGAGAARDWAWPATRALRGAPLTGGVSSDIWRIDLAARAGVRQARAGQAARGRRLARADRTQSSTKRAGCNWPTRRCRACAPRVLGQHAGLGVLVMEYLPQHALWKHQLRDGQAEAGTARAVGRALARIHGHSAARPDAGGAVCHRCDLLRHPPRALSAGHRPAGIRTLAERLQALVAQTQAHAIARWCMAMSARRTSSSTATGRCSWTPNAPCGATRRSTWRSA